MARLFWREGRRILLRVFGVLGQRVVIAVCLLLALSSGIGAWRNLWFAARGSVVNGLVVRHQVELLADWRGADAARADGFRMAAAQRVYQSVVQFTLGARTYDIVSAQRGPVPAYPLGSTQVVVVPFGRPEDARVRAELPDFWTQAGLLLMATVIGAATVRWWWSMARRQRRFRPRPKRSTPPVQAPDTTSEDLRRA